MFKKSIFIMVLALMFAAVSLSYADFGLSARLGRNIGENNNFDHYLINTGISTPSITTDRLEWYKNYDKSDFINYGLEIFCEFPLSNKAFVGLKAGYVGYVNTDAQSVYFLDYYKYRNGSYGDIDKRYSVLYETSIESDAYEIPITIYYKEKINRIFSFYTGVGISFLSNKWTAKYYANTNYIPYYSDEHPMTDADIDPSKAYSYSHTDTDTTVVPLFLLGAEAQLSKHFSLTFDITFRYGGKTAFRTEENFELTRNFSGVAAALAVRYYVLGSDIKKPAPPRRVRTVRPIPNIKPLNPQP